MTHAEAAANLARVQRDPKSTYDDLEDALALYEACSPDPAVVAHEYDEESQRDLELHERLA